MESESKRESLRGRREDEERKSIDNRNTVVRMKARESESVSVRTTRGRQEQESLLIIVKGAKAKKRESIMVGQFRLQHP